MTCSTFRRDSPARYPQYSREIVVLLLLADVPQLIEADVDKEGLFERHRVLDGPREIIQVERCGISRSGACFTISGIHEDSYHSGYRGFGYEIWKTTLLQSARYGITRWRPDRDYLLFHNSWSGGYYHWIAEALPRLLGFRDRWKDHSIVIPPRMPNAWFRDWLKGIGKSNVQAEAGLSFVRTVTFQSNPRVMTEVSADGLNLVSDYFRRLFLGRTSGKGPEKVYITREKAGHRKVSNEREVIEYLRKEGFVICDPSGMTFPQQVSLFGSARVVMSIHGAGLSNILFMPPGGVVVEFFQRPDPAMTFGTRRNTHLLNPCYRAISQVMGHEYEVVLGSVDMHSSPPDSIRKYGSLHANISVDITDIENLSYLWK